VKRVVFVLVAAGVGLLLWRYKIKGLDGARAGVSVKDGLLDRGNPVLDKARKAAADVAETAKSIAAR
jgi:hypothetical protein